jgi:predicted AlkP superfamily phosphohydrolase/phosphomutase
MKDRVLVIGLDGATWVALDPLMASGRMPALAALVAKGFRAPLESTVPPVTAPAWSSFITGQNPGRHGIYQFYEIDPWSERALGRGADTFMAEPGVVVNGTALGGPKLWEVAGAVGLRCATINLPMTYPPSEINGLMVTDMLTPPGSRRFTWPAELADELTDYEIDLTPREKSFTSTDDDFLDRAEAVLDKRGRAVLDLFGREAWDLFVAVFTESDRIQHRYWQHLDPRSPAPSDPAERRVRDRVLALYERLDGYIARLVEAAGDRYRIAVVSDHGFGHAAFRRVNMQKLAEAIGLGSAPSATSQLARFGITKKRLYKYLGGLVPEGRLRNAERMARDRALRDVKGKLVKLHDYIGGVWIHRASRGGPVPDDEVPALRDRLVERLLTVVNEGTGSPFVTRAVAREAIYEGDRIASAPDVVFFLDDRYGLDPTPREPSLVYRWEPPNTGTHRADGVVLLCGPGLAPAAPEAPPRIEDVAPTILHLLGLPVPSAMDGRVLVEAFTPDLRASRPVAVSDDAYRPAAERGEWDSDEEQDEIMERLRGIGYVE